MPKNKNKLINLLPQEGFDATIAGRTLKWAMGTFRIIVIVTEMIVMGAFLSRFWLDARNSDLNDSIDIKKAQVLSQSEFETEFRSIQKRLAVFEEMDKDQRISDLINRITSKVPSEINLSSASFQDATAQVKGVAENEFAIAQFVSNLGSDQFFKEASLGQVNQSDTNPLQTVFTINIKY